MTKTTASTSDSRLTITHCQICEKIIHDKWKVEWIMDQRVPYAHGDEDWIGFDSPDSTSLKVMMMMMMMMMMVMMMIISICSFTSGLNLLYLARFYLP